MRNLEDEKLLSEIKMILQNFRKDIRDRSSERSSADEIFETLRNYRNSLPPYTPLVSVRDCEALTLGPDYGPGTSLYIREALAGVKSE